jgi:hypothetical protein
MVRAYHRVSSQWLLFLAILPSTFGPGCGLIPRSRWDESQRLSQTLRSENARLKDQVLALQGQNRDCADRAVDDLRRLSARDEAIERLERSVQAYQEDRDRLSEAYERLTTSLGRQPSAVGALREPARFERGPGTEPRSPASAESSPKRATVVEDQEADR